MFLLSWQHVFSLSHPMHQLYIRVGYLMQNMKEDLNQSLIRKDVVFYFVAPSRPFPDALFSGSFG
jgi:hypothetical protein